ncbi:sugar ABC transporter substrate-binding protein [Streptomonospora litoralis]|uniref:Putative ABC transporter-binding protein n=1 Tax=Streptomonospora litoralis TaxID=2498135 RepID=A0A4P6Q3V8_9ACTN|nr:sugar ABC transporter substrate-binding protein [Streptomonospora litoralis]QBI55305.1 putative ABC transporter-binding protein precursor [Streptomonospora litoralis]
MARTRARARRSAAAAAVVALLAAACGSGGADGGEGRTLDVWIMQGTHPDATAYFDDVARQFREETGARVDVEFVPWADAHDKFVTAIAGNTMPDVAEVGTTWTLEFAGAGALMDVSDRVGSTDAYVPSLTEAGTLDGGLYGVPWYAGVRSVLYRTDVFDELGLEQPTTWAELRETAIEISERRDDMTAFPVPGDAVYQMLPFVWGSGGDIATSSGPTWTSGLDGAQAREGLSFYTDLALQDGVSSTGAATWMETDLQDEFISGDVAMMVAGSWTPKAILEANPDLEGRIGAFPVPGPDGGLSPSFLGGSHLSVFNSADDPDLAWSYVELLTNDENARRWSQATTYFPGKQEQLQPYTSSDDPLVQPFAEQMSEAGRGLPATENFGKVQGDMVLQAMLQDILNEEASVEEATARAAEQVEQTLNEGA